MTLLGGRGAPLILFVGIVALDSIIKSTSPPYSILALFDEPAHLATAGIALAAAVQVRRLPTTVVIAALASSVLIDTDHIPQVLGWQGLTAGTPRPYSHSLLTVAVLGLTSAVVPRRRATLLAVLVGACAGVALHLWRDLGTGQASLLWPISRHGFALSYLLYISPLVLLAAWCGRRPRLRARTDRWRSGERRGR